MKSAAPARTTCLTLLLAIFAASCSSDAAQQNQNQNLPNSIYSVSPDDESRGFVLAQQPEQSPSRNETIAVVYPTSGATIAAASTFIVGAIPPGMSLTCNGDAVRVNSHGYYAHVVHLNYGKNTFTLSIPGSATRVVEAVREKPASSISPDTFTILQETASPREDRGVEPGDMIEFSVRATPLARVEVHIGSHKLLLSPSAPKTRRRTRASRTRQVSGKRVTASVNRGMDVAFGKTYQRGPEAYSDLYVGTYRIQTDDQWNKLKPKFILSRGGKSTSVTANGAISVVSQPYLAQTAHDKTIVRVGPGQARITPLPAGVRLLVDGWHGNHIRCQYGRNKHVWILNEELRFETAEPLQDTGLDYPAVSLPSSAIRTINLQSDGYGDTIILPLNQRLPFQIEQYMKPNRLVMKVYGATADTDWVSPAEGYRLQQSGAASEGNAPLSPVDHVTWRQFGDGVYELTAHLKTDRQWGFKGEYDGSNLMLRVKRAPRLQPSAPLKGLRICIDPGHGGTETGSIGCSGVRESRVNLDISLKLQRVLQQYGATVIMTRTSESETVSLDERVNIALREDADILLSVHNNALPDGQDPWKEHGTSSYWYHPQATSMARTIKDAVVREVGFPDFATRYQNLALCRPSAMPAALAEIGFMIHPDEFAQLIDPETQEKIARGLLHGIINYLSPLTTKDSSGK